MMDDDVIEQVVTREGGYIDHPADRGGPTKFGITAATLGNWRGLPVAAAREDVASLARAEALAIYRVRYIEQPGFTAVRVPNGRLRAALIDEGVISGPVLAVKTLQRALGIPADGVIGPQTTAAVQSADDDAPRRQLKERALRMVRIVEADRTQLVFLRGWISRCFDLLA